MLKETILKNRILEILKLKQVGLQGFLNVLQDCLAKNQIA